MIENLQLGVRQCLIGLLSFASWGTAVGQEAPRDQQRGVGLLQELEGAISGVIQRCERSVVSIVRTNLPPEQLTARARPNQFRGDIIRRNNQVVPVPGFEPFIQEVSPPPLACGAGVVIDESGLILTQYRVVKLGDTHLVTDADGQRYYATIRAADPRSGLAVLAINRPLGGKRAIDKRKQAAGDKDSTDFRMPSLAIGEAERLSKGRFVVAIGNPFSIESDGQATASWGTVTNTALKAPADENLNDDKFVDGSYKTTLHHFGSLIQTDAKLGWNASGGALVNLDGDLIGIMTTAASIAGHEQPAGYAIPLNEAMRRAVESMREGLEPEYGLLGVNFNPTPNLSPLTSRRGIRVNGVFTGGPAYLAGIRGRDLLLSVNGKPLRSTDALQLAIGSLSPGSEATIRYERSGEVLEAAVSLGKAYIESGQVVTRRRPSWRGIRVDFATAIPPQVLGERAGSGHLDEAGCVVVAEVEKGTVSWDSGVRPYSYISHVGGERVTTPDEFFEAVGKAGDNVKLKFTKPLPAQVSGKAGDAAG